MKKLFVFLLLSLVILAFAACGGKTEPETPAVTEPGGSAADAQTDVAGTQGAVQTVLFDCAHSHKQMNIREGEFLV